jgi:hypothetical protein
MQAILRALRLPGRPQLLGRLFFAERVARALIRPAGTFSRTREKGWSSRIASVIRSAYSQRASGPRRNAPEVAIEERRFGAMRFGDCALRSSD